MALRHSYSPNVITMWVASSFGIDRILTLYILHQYTNMLASLKMCESYSLNYYATECLAVSNGAWSVYLNITQNVFKFVCVCVCFNYSICRISNHLFGKAE